MHFLYGRRITSWKTLSYFLQIFDELLKLVIIIFAIDRSSLLNIIDVYYTASIPKTVTKALLENRPNFAFFSADSLMETQSFDYSLIFDAPFQINVQSTSMKRYKISSRMRLNSDKLPFELGKLITFVVNCKQPW